MKTTVDEEMHLPKVDAKYLQAFLIKSAPEMRISECELILKHILGNSRNVEKKFYSFFHPKHQ